ncbi:Coenzyme F420 hydrogenase/dehydrogenase, beta subunit C-terminal domain [Acetoanaerobium sticklandii]|uniref:Coenzyme F420 hydrogenase/dehydrogenase, beta subunit C-terminal domain n=1 Tax=Acetoanaerobium sticklandii TaxID=1511 RepID=UPI003A947038
MANISIYKKEHCFGCTACYNVCPQDCITMEFDNEGFKFPIVYKSACINCGVCVIHCPITNDFINKEIKQCFGLIHDSSEITNKSASGGAFTAIADLVIQQEGIVYGCGFNDDIEAITMSVDNAEDVSKLRGSKYVQCDNLSQYSEIKKQLNLGIEVLYASTPCNVSGLKAFLGKNFSNLTTVDLFCHGVPSPVLFNKYIQWLEKKYNGKVTEYSFRDKKYGWGTQGHFTIRGKSRILYGTDPYYNSFLQAKTYRLSCYECKFASDKRPGDISIGDFWGVEHFHPEIDTTRGVSAILINTEKGISIKQRMECKVTLFETSFDNISFLNKQLVYPTIKPQIRDLIYLKFQELDFNKFIHEYLFSSPEITIKIKQLIPTKLKVYIRKISSLVVNKTKNRSEKR